MSEKINEQQVRHVAKLARLLLTEDDVRRFAPQLSDVLGYVEQLALVDTTGVEPLAHPIETINVTRPDEVIRNRHDGFSADDALRNAPDLHDRYFRVPGVFGDSGS